MESGVEAEEEMGARLQAMSVASTELLRARSLQARQDWKYLIPRKMVPELLHALTETHSVLLAGESRLGQYRTQYFDTSDLRLYHDHRRGRRLRSKVRMRSYLERKLTVVEIKSKVGDSKTLKTRQELAWGSVEPLEDCRDFLAAHRLSEPLFPSIGNQFRRISLLGQHSDERVSIDLDLMFRKAVGLGGAWDESESFDQVVNKVCVVEVKANSREAYPLGRVQLRRLGARPQSFSKYCVGMILLRPEIRANRFLPMMRNLARMEEM